MIGGSLIAGQRGLHPDRIRTLSRGLVAAMLGCLIGALRPSGLLLAAGCVVALGFVPFVNAAMATIYNDRVPPPMQGRVFALRGAVSQVLQPIGALVAGLIISGVAGPALEAPVLGDVLRPAVGGTGRGAALTLAGVGVSLGLVAVALGRSRLRDELRAGSRLHV